MISQAVTLRKEVLAANRCTFRGEIIADYEDYVYKFTLDCEVDSNGDLLFSIVEPESIAGIDGRISRDGGALTFDDKVLAFPTLADNELTPVSTPWIFINTLRSGNLTGCSQLGDDVCVYIDDSYEEYPLQLEIYTDSQMRPNGVEIVWQNRRILSMKVQDFTIE